MRGFTIHKFAAVVAVILASPLAGAAQATTGVHERPHHQATEVQVDQQNTAANSAHPGIGHGVVMAHDTSESPATLVSPVDVCGPIKARTNGCWVCDVERNEWHAHGRDRGASGEWTWQACVDPWEGVDDDSSPLVRNWRDLGSLRPTTVDLSSPGVSFAASTALPGTEPLTVGLTASAPPRVEWMHSVFDGVARWVLRLIDDGPEVKLEVEHTRSTGQVRTRVVQP